MKNVIFFKVRLLNMKNSDIIVILMICKWGFGFNMIF